jgi:hypothetical protein
LAIGARSRLAAYKLAGDVDVVALLEGLGDDGALAKEGDGKELAVFDGSSLRVVEPALCQSRAHKLTASGIGDRRLVGEISGKNDLVKYFHGSAPQLPGLRQRHGQWPRCREWAVMARRVSRDLAGPR